jgi:N-acyl-D-amino-acid deacylase
MYDLLIRGGRIVDGTGSLWFRADVAVEGDKVRLLRGDTSQVEARRVIDASGLVVSPGFIDMHAHSGMVILREPRHEPKVRQGVTTELIGIDGNSYAPFLSERDLQDFITLNAGLDGRPPAGVRWTSVEEYLAFYDDKVAVNVAYVVGNSPLRISAMGWGNRRPTSDEARRMVELLLQAMEQGALGMSTGLNYPPGSYADTDELVELCKAVSGLGGIYVTHVRYPMGDRFIDPFQEALAIGRRSGVHVHISHFASNQLAAGAPRILLGMIDQARAEGVPVTFDAYPYVYPSTRLEALIPEWAHDGGLGPLLERMADADERRRMAQDPETQRRDPRFILVTNFKHSRNKRFEGMSLAAIAQTLGKSVIDALCDLLLEEELDLAYVAISGNPVNIRQFLQHPAATVGSDALLIGDRPSPRSYGCFPTMLGDLVREEQTLSLADCIRKMTSLPAQTLGLRDRGVLRDGFKADIAIFDPTRVRSPATLENPKQFPQGIDYVIVNGKVVIDRGQHTGATPGRALRRGA